jgi:hypothetical protein
MSKPYLRCWFISSANVPNQEIHEINEVFPPSQKKLRNIVSFFNHAGDPILQTLDRINIAIALKEFFHLLTIDDIKTMDSASILAFNFCSNCNVKIDIIGGTVNYEIEILNFTHTLS